MSRRLSVVLLATFVSTAACDAGVTPMPDDMRVGAMPAGAPSLRLSALARRSGGGGGSATLTFEEFRRYATATEWYEHWYDGGQSLDETGGVAYVTDDTVAHVLLAQAAADGETITWRFLRPDGSLDTSISVAYDADTGCWSGGIGNTCFRDVYWFIGAQVNGDPQGTWQVEVLDNGTRVMTQSFRLDGYTLSVASGNGQVGLARSSLPQPLRVRLVDVDGSTPVSGQSVAFSLTKKPNGSKGGGLTASLVSPPDGSETSTLYATTDAAGEAEVYLVMGSGDGDHQVTATNRYAQPAPAVVFTETAKQPTLYVRELATPTIDLYDYPSDVFYQATMSGGAVQVQTAVPFGSVLDLATTIQVTVDADTGIPAGQTPHVALSWKMNGMSSYQSAGAFDGTSGALVITPTLAAPSASQYGAQAIFLKLDLSFVGSRARATSQTIEPELWLFFNTYNDDDADGAPNWAEYWQGTSAAHRADGSAYPYQYDAGVQDYGSAPNCWADPSGTLLVGDYAGGNIDVFAQTLVHEDQHEIDCRAWWPTGIDASRDLDTDKVPDTLEPGLGYDPTKTDTDGDTYPDFEDHAYDAESAWVVGSAKYEDWSFPGSQAH